MAKSFYELVDEIFRHGVWENEWRPFADGSQSNFATELEEIMFLNGKDVIKDVNNIIESYDEEGINANVIHEAFVLIGSVKDDTTHESRRLLLEKFLKSKNLTTRDSASIGIDAMGDIKSLNAIEEAIRVETDKWEKNWFTQIRDSLS